MFILEKMPFVIQVIFFGALLSVIMSTASGTLLAPSVTFSENILKSVVPHMSDKQFLWATKLTVACFAVIVTFYAIYTDESIHTMVEHAYRITLAGAFVPLAAGLFWKRASNLGAALAITFGLGVWLLLEFTNAELLRCLLIVPFRARNQVGNHVQSTRKLTRPTWRTNTLARPHPLKCRLWFCTPKDVMRFRHSSASALNTGLASRMRPRRKAASDLMDRGVLEALRQMPDAPPVIVISAQTEMSGVIRCIELGAEDYQPKSFDPPLLRARLSAVLEKKRLRDLAVKQEGEAKALLEKQAGEAEAFKEINIRAKRNDNVKKIDISTQSISGKTIKKIPAFLGEADVIKSIQLLPGVTTVGEGAS
jgi:hypothetical protein